MKGLPGKLDAGNDFERSSHPVPLFPGGPFFLFSADVRKKFFKIEAVFYFLVSGCIAQVPV